MWNSKIIPIILWGTLLFVPNGNAQQHRIAMNGNADYSNHDFSKSKVALSGEWEFYWKQLLSPEDFDTHKNTLDTKYIGIPSLWNDYNIDNQKINHLGFATYRLQFRLPADEDLLVLKVPKAFSSYKLFINGKLKIEVGKVGSSVKETRHERFDSIIPFITRPNQQNEIVIQVANFYHKNGGLAKSPVIGNSTMMLKENDIKKSSDAMLWGSLIFIGLAFLFLYSLWRKDKAILFYSLFAIFWAYRNMSDGYAPLASWLPFVGWELNAKIEYVALYLSFISASLYFNIVFKKKSHPKFKIIIYWLSAIFIVLTLFSPNTVFTHFLMPFFLAMLINGIYTVIVVYKSMIDQNRSSLFALASISIAIIVFLAHLYTFYLEQDSYAFYFNVGYLLVFLCSAMLLGVRFSKGFFKLASLQVETNEQKEELEAQAELLKNVNNQINNQRQLLAERNEEINAINSDLEHKINERTAKLKKTNKELDLFLYRASHDLRRPVSTILGIDEIANLTVKEKNALELFGKVQNTVFGMDRMLKKIISISEIYNHPVNLQTITNPVITNTIQSQAKYFASLFPKKNYNLEVDLPEAIYSDFFLINKITTYLIENCFTFSPADNTKKLEINIKFFTENNRVCLTVTDNGKGIKKNQFDNIFDMYFIGNESSKGNGLGLHIVKKAVNKLEGSIKVESEIDCGSTFWIELNSTTLKN